jgi:hypothetical protein
MRSGVMNLSTLKRNVPILIQVHLLIDGSIRSGVQYDVNLAKKTYFYIASGIQTSLWVEYLKSTYMRLYYPK